MTDDITARIEEVLLGFGSAIGATKYRAVAERIVQQLELNDDDDESLDDLRAAYSVGEKVVTVPPEGMTGDITARIAEIIKTHWVCHCGEWAENLEEQFIHVAEQIVRQLGLEREYDEYDEDGDRIPPYTRWCTAWELMDKPLGKPTSGGPWHYLRTMMRRGGVD